MIIYGITILRRIIILTPPSRLRRATPKVSGRGMLQHDDIASHYDGEMALSGQFRSIRRRFIHDARHHVTRTHARY